MPTPAEYLQFIRNVMGIPTSALPDNLPVIAMSFDVALEIVNLTLNQMSSLIYTLAVYNLAGDNLINFAPDQPGSNYFATARTSFNSTGFVAGVIGASADESTSQTLITPDAMKNLTLADLQNLKTPWGRQYLAFAQSYGTLWGLT